MNAKIIMIVQSIISILCISCAFIYVDDGKADNDTDAVATVDGVEYTDLQEAFDQAVAPDSKHPGRTVQLEILKDVELTSWTSVYFNSYDGKNPDEIFVNGNGHTISGITDALFLGTWTGKTLSISDITIKDSNLSTTRDEGAQGALIANVSCTEHIVLKNCIVTHSSITGGKWTGGLIGYATGYSTQDDGPVFTVVDISNCIISNNTIDGKGSAGSLIGHATGDAWTEVNVHDTFVHANIIKGEKASKVGIIFGTIGAAKTQFEKDGAVNIYSLVSYDNVSEFNAYLFGRIGSPGGTINVYAGDYRDLQFTVSDPTTSTNIKVSGGIFKGQGDLDTYKAKEKELAQIATDYYAVGAGSYELSFEMNGHGQQVEPLNIEFTKKATEPEAPQQSGFVFDGWFVDPEFNLAWDFGKDVVVMNTKLYAKWSEQEGVTVTFNANDGTSTTKTQIVEIGVDTPLDPNTFTREGYAFITWNTKADGSGTPYADGQTINIDEDLTLYAMWNEFTLTVTFNPNGGKGDVYEQTIKWSDATKTLTPNAFTKEGYAFKEWMVTGGTATYADKADVSALIVSVGGTLSLDAQWSTYEVTITFNSNDGTGTTIDQKIKSQTPTALDANTFTREGYAFVKWNTKADGSGDSYADKAVVTLTEDLTLYAMWDEFTLTVTFNANGGSGTMDKQTIKWSDATKTLTPNTFTNEGYVFKEWKVTGGTATYADKADVSALIVSVGGTLSLDAQWSTYEVTITFNANGGTGSMPDQKVQSQTPTALSANTFTRDGYNYVWWNTQADGKGITYADKEEVSLTADITLYAIWEQKPVEKFTVTFDSNGGSAVAPVSVQSGTIVEKPENPSKAGSKFAGWFSDSAYASRYTFTEPVTRDITLYAKWIGVVNVSVPSGDGYTSAPAGTTSVTIGEDFTFTIAAKDGYTVTEVYANDGLVGTGPGTFVLESVLSDVSITVVYTYNGKTTETSESTVDNDDGTVTTNETKTETDDASGSSTISEKSTTKDGETVKSTATATADVTSTSIDVKVNSDTDSATVSGSIAEAIDAAAGTVENKSVSVTTPKKTVTIEKEAWDILGDAAVTVTVNNGADFQASITVSKDSFDTQSALALAVLESSKDIPSDIGKTTKAFELDAKMGGNPVSSFSNEVRVVMVFDTIPSSVTKVYAYCIDTGDRVDATFDAQTGEVTFDTPHFSSWTIIYEESSPSGGNVSTTALIIAAVAVALALIIVAVVSTPRVPKNNN